MGLSDAYGENAMPSMAKSIIDSAYIALLEDWINNYDTTTIDPIVGINGSNLTSKDTLSLLVYPNPFINVIYVKASLNNSNLSRYKLRIFDTEGRIMYQNFDFKPSQVLEIPNHWPTGTYFTNVTAGAESQSLKIVKH